MKLTRRCSLALLACVGLAVSMLAAGLASGTQAWKAGSLDRSFADGGRKLTNFFGARDQAAAVAIQNSDRIVVAGTADIPRSTGHGGSRIALAGYRRDGRLDRGFGDRGKAIVRRCGEGGYQSRGGGLAIQPNGRIIVAGECTPDLALVRFRRSGELDRSFGDQGKVITGLRPGLNHATDVAIQPDGKIVVVGYTRGAADGATYLIMARYRRNGSLDQGFGNGGSVITQFGQDTYVLGYGVAIQEDGRIVVSGEVGNSWIVARFMPDGTLDTGFGNDAGVQHTDPVSVGRALDVAIQPDGGILAAGVDFGGEIASARFALARYLPDGAPDPSFGEGGAVRTAFERGLPSDYANALALQPDGKIVVAGTARFRYDNSTPARFALARYRPNGSLDRSFAGDGKRITGFRPSPPRRHRDKGMDLVIQANGRIVVAGYTDPNRGNDDFALARYLGAARH